MLVFNYVDGAQPLTTNQEQTLREHLDEVFTGYYKPTEIVTVSIFETLHGYIARFDLGPQAGNSTRLSMRQLKLISAFEPTRWVERNVDSVTYGFHAKALNEI